MIRKGLSYAVLLALLVPAAAAAQQRPVLEIGMKAGFGLTRTEFDGETETVKEIGIPTGTAYLAFFPSDNIFVEPELAFRWASDDDVSATAFGLVGWLSFAPAGVSANSFYVGAAPALQYIKIEDESASQWGAAGRVGYRSIVRDALAVRFEAGFTRWFETDDELAYNVITIGVGIGGLLGRAM